MYVGTTVLSYSQSTAVSCCFRWLRPTGLRVVIAVLGCFSSCNTRTRLRGCVLRHRHVRSARTHTSSHSDALKRMQCMDEMESELELIGVTAIEDKLQAEVPQSIATMLDAGVKVRAPFMPARAVAVCLSDASGTVMRPHSVESEIYLHGSARGVPWIRKRGSWALSWLQMRTSVLQVWMITGDKQETAINIAVSCNLFTNTDGLLICNAGKKDVMQKIEQVCAQRACAHA